MNKQLKFVTYGAVLLALAAVFPLLRLPQYLTGSVVNFVLLIACHVLGILGGVVIGCLTPWIALIAGQNAFCIYASIYYDWKCDFSNCVLDFLRGIKTTGMIVGLVFGEHS